jgi:hypothetical protein
MIDLDLTKSITNRLLQRIELTKKIKAIPVIKFSTTNE